MAESEKFTVSGSNLVEKVKELIHQGNVRRLAQAMGVPTKELFSFEEPPPGSNDQPAGLTNKEWFPAIVLVEFIRSLPHRIRAC